MSSLTNSTVGIQVWVLVLLTVLSQLNTFAQNMVQTSPAVHITAAHAGKQGGAGTCCSSKSITILGANAWPSYLPYTNRNAENVEGSCLILSPFL